VERATTWRCPVGNGNRPSKKTVTNHNLNPYRYCGTNNPPTEVFRCSGRYWEVLHGLCELYHPQWLLKSQQFVSGPFQTFWIRKCLEQSGHSEGASLFDFCHRVTISTVRVGRAGRYSGDKLYRYATQE